MKGYQPFRIDPHLTDENATVIVLAEIEMHHKVFQQSKMDR